MESALPAFLATGLADEAELVVVLEPTANAIQAGCLGHISATLVFEGRSGHSARPWLACISLRKRIARASPTGAGRLGGAPPRAP